MSNPTDKWQAPEWLNGVSDWAKGANDYVDQWGNAIQQNVVNPLVANALTPYNWRNDVGVLEAGAQMGTAAANMAATGLGAIVAGPKTGVDRTAEAVRRYTDPNHPQYSPMIPQYSPQIAPQQAGQVLQGAETLFQPIADAGPALGSAVMDATGSPGAATAAHIAPDALLASVGLGSVRRGLAGKPPNFDPFIDYRPALDGPTRGVGGTVSDRLFGEIEGVTGRGGPGKYEEGAVRITGRDPETGLERYEHTPAKKKVNPSQPFYTSPLLDLSMEDLGKTPNQPEYWQAPEEGFISAVPQAMRFINHKSAPASQWIEDFADAGVNESQLRFTGIMDVLKGGGEVSRSKIADAYNRMAPYATMHLGTMGDQTTKQEDVMALGFSKDDLVNVRDAANAELTDMADLPALAAPGVNAGKVKDIIRTVEMAVHDARTDRESILISDNANRYDTEAINDLIQWDRGGRDMVNLELGRAGADEETITAILDKADKYIDLQMETAKAVSAYQARNQDKMGQTQYRNKGEMGYPSVPGTEFDQIVGFNADRTPYENRTTRFGAQNLAAHWPDLFARQETYLPTQPDTLAHMGLTQHPVMDAPTYFETDEDGVEWEYRPTSLHMVQAQSDPGQVEFFKPHAEGYDAASPNLRGQNRNLTAEEILYGEAIKRKAGDAEIWRQELRDMRNRLWDDAPELETPHGISESMGIEGNDQIREALRNIDPDVAFRGMGSGYVEFGRGLWDAHQELAKRIRAGDEVDIDQQYQSNYLRFVDAKAQEMELQEMSNAYQDHKDLLKEEAMRYTPGAFATHENQPLITDRTERQYAFSLAQMERAAIMGHEYFSMPSQREHGSAYSNVGGYRGMMNYSNVLPEPMALALWGHDGGTAGRVVYNEDRGEYIDLDNGDEISGSDLTDEFRQAIDDNAPSWSDFYEEAEPLFISTEAERRIERGSVSEVEEWQDRSGDWHQDEDEAKEANRQIWVDDNPYPKPDDHDLGESDLSQYEGDLYEYVIHRSEYVPDSPQDQSRESRYPKPEGGNFGFPATDFTEALNEWLIEFEGEEFEGDRTQYFYDSQYGEQIEDPDITTLQEAAEHVVREELSNGDLDRDEFVNEAGQTWEQVLYEHAVAPPIPEPDPELSGLPQDTKMPWPDPVPWSEWGSEATRGAGLTYYNDDMITGTYLKVLTDLGLTPDEIKEVMPADPLDDLFAEEDKRRLNVEKNDILAELTNRTKGRKDPDTGKRDPDTGDPSYPQTEEYASLRDRVQELDRELSPYKLEGFEVRIGSPQMAEGRRQRVRGGKMTPALERALREKKAGGFFGIAPTGRELEARHIQRTTAAQEAERRKIEREKAKANKPNPGDIKRKYTVGEITYDQAVEELAAAGVPVERAGKLLGPRPGSLF